MTAEVTLNTSLVWREENKRSGELIVILLAALTLFCCHPYNNSRGSLVFYQLMGQHVNEREDDSLGNGPPRSGLAEKLDADSPM